MDTGQKGYTSLGKGLHPYKRPSVLSETFESTTAEIEQHKSDVETGRGRGAEPLRGTKTAQAHDKGQ